MQQAWQRTRPLARRAVRRHLGCSRDHAPSSCSGWAAGIAISSLLDANRSRHCDTSPLPPLREASLLLSRVTWLIRALGSALVIGSTALYGAYVGSDYSHATRASDREKLLVETLQTPVEIAGIFLGFGVAICLAIDLIRAGDTHRRDAISRLIPVVGASAVLPGSGAIRVRKVAVRVLDDLTTPPWTFLIARFLPGGIFLLAVALVGE